MAMAILAQLAQLPAKRVAIVLAFVWGCEPVNTPIPVSNHWLEASMANGNFKDGRLLVKEKPYNGYRYALYQDRQDTIMVSSYADGLEHGTWRKYHENGMRMEIRRFVYGKKEGEMHTWWENGQLQSTLQFRNDEYEGTCREWNREGKPIREMNYHMGHENGDQKQWYDDGSIRSNYTIKNGRRFGLLGTKNCINVSDSLDLP